MFAKIQSLHHIQIFQPSCSVHSAAGADASSSVMWQKQATQSMKTITSLESQKLATEFLKKKPKVVIVRNPGNSAAKRKLSSVCHQMLWKLLLCVI